MKRGGGEKWMEKYMEVVTEKREKKRQKIQKTRGWKSEGKGMYRARRDGGMDESRYVGVEGRWLIMSLPI